MINHELIAELLLQKRDLPVVLQLIDHDDITFHYSPIYSVRFEEKDALHPNGSIVISGVPPEILKKFEEE